MFCFWYLIFISLSSFFPGCIYPYLTKVSSKCERSIYVSYITFYLIDLSSYKESLFRFFIHIISAFSLVILLVMLFSGTFTLLYFGMTFCFRHCLLNLIFKLHVKIDSY
jgi:hypothetical protein